MASSGARVPYVINVDFCNRPLPVPDKLFHSPAFSYASIVHPQIRYEPLHNFTAIQSIGALGHVVNLAKILGDVLMFSLKFSTRQDRLSRTDRHEAFLPPKNPELLQDQWLCIASRLQATFNTIPDSLKNINDIIKLIQSGLPITRSVQYQFTIFSLYSFCFLLLHIPSSMTLQLPTTPKQKNMAAD